jgi:hypothetical protein
VAEQWTHLTSSSIRFNKKWFQTFDLFSSEMSSKFSLLPSVLLLKFSRISCNFDSEQSSSFIGVGVSSFKQEIEFF